MKTIVDPEWNNDPTGKLADAAKSLAAARNAAIEALGAAFIKASGLDPADGAIELVEFRESPTETRFFFRKRAKLPDQDVLTREMLALSAWLVNDKPYATRAKKRAWSKLVREIAFAGSATVPES